MYEYHSVNWSKKPESEKKNPGISSNNFIEKTGICVPSEVCERLTLTPAVCLRGYVSLCVDKLQFNWK